MKKRILGSGNPLSWKIYDNSADEDIRKLKTMKEGESWTQKRKQRLFP